MRRGTDRRMQLTMAPQLAVITVLDSALDMRAETLSLRHIDGSPTNLQQDAAFALIAQINDLRQELALYHRLLVPALGPAAPGAQR